MRCVARHIVHLAVECQTHTRTHVHPAPTAQALALAGAKVKELYGMAESALAKAK